MEAQAKPQSYCVILSGVFIVLRTETPHVSLQALTACSGWVDDQKSRQNVESPCYVELIVC